MPALGRIIDHVICVLKKGQAEKLLDHTNRLDTTGSLYCCQVNNYIVKSYRVVIVVTSTAERRTNKASIIIEYSHVLKYKTHY